MINSNSKMIRTNVLLYTAINLIIFAADRYVPASVPFLLYGTLIIAVLRNLDFSIGYLLAVDIMYFLIKRNATDPISIPVFRDFGMAAIIVVILFNQTRCHCLNKSTTTGERALIFFLIVVSMGFLRTNNLIQYAIALREYLTPMLFVLILIKYKSQNLKYYLLSSLLAQLAIIAVMEGHNAFFPHSSIFAFIRSGYDLEIYRTMFGYSGNRTMISMFVGGPTLGAILLSGIGASLTLYALTAKDKTQIKTLVFISLSGLLLIAGLRFLSFSMVFAVLIPIMVSVCTLAKKGRIKIIVLLLCICPAVLIPLSRLGLLEFSDNIGAYAKDYFLYPALTKQSKEITPLIFGNDIVGRTGAMFEGQIETPDNQATRGWFTYLYNFGLIGFVPFMFYVIWLTRRAFRIVMDDSIYRFLALFYFTTFAMIHLSPYLVRPFTSILITLTPLILSRYNELAEVHTSSIKD